MNGGWGLSDVSNEGISALRVDQVLEDLEIDRVRVFSSPSAHPVADAVLGHGSEANLVVNSEIIDGVSAPNSETIALSGEHELARCVVFASVKAGLVVRVREDGGDVSWGSSHGGFDSHLNDAVLEGGRGTTGIDGVFLAGEVDKEARRDDAKTNQDLDGDEETSLITKVGLVNEITHGEEKVAKGND
jgi:hypothetical protein